MAPAELRRLRLPLRLDPDHLPSPRDEARYCYRFHQRVFAIRKRCWSLHLPLRLGPVLSQVLVSLERKEHRAPS